MRFFLALLIACALAESGGSAPSPDFREKDFKGNGLCLFATEGFTLAPQTEKAVNDSVQKLLERHQSVLGFSVRPEFRFRMRVFARFQDYTNATLSRYMTNAIERQRLAGHMINLTGFYSPLTREIVTWRQNIPGTLGITLLHEAGHAIMDAHYDRLPIWLLEGSAEYFAYALNNSNEMNKALLRHRWTQLNQWQKADQLLPLSTLLSADHDAFMGLDPDKSYAMSWSLFQLLMSSEANRTALRALLRERKPSSRQSVQNHDQLARVYPGGLPRLETDLESWIRAGAGITNPPSIRIIRVGE
jgi:hypothetical protein